MYSHRSQNESQSTQTAADGLLVHRLNRLAVGTSLRGFDRRDRPDVSVGGRDRSCNSWWIPASLALCRGGGYARVSQGHFPSARLPHGARLLGTLNSS
jgi:hypothetical protein